MTKYDQILGYWKSKNVKGVAELAEALNGQSILFAYNSGRIENQHVTYSDTRDIFERDGVSSYTGDLRTLFEIRNAKAGCEYFLTAFDDRLPLNQELLLEMQKLLTLNTYDERRYKLGERPGTYKLHDYVTGKNEIGARPEDVETEVNELLAELDNISDENALTAAAYFHVKLENIHPFADGNGRTGRMLMNYFLVMHNHPPITIHEEDRKEYYAALEAWDEVQDLEPMISFLKEQAIKTWGNYL